MNIVRPGAAGGTSGKGKVVSAARAAKNFVAVLENEAQQQVCSALS